MESTIILSICIPTYNRGSLLFHCLKSITEQDIFRNTSKIEIVISDNASEDWTKNIVEFFIRQHPHKIHYHQNKENIQDRNFETALSLGRGTFLKLVNDSFIFHDGALEAMVHIIEKYSRERPILFFSNGNIRKGDIIPCSSLDEFITEASYLITWTGGFGLWHDDFERRKDFSRYAGKRLAQTEVLLSAVASTRKSVIDNRTFCHVQYVWNKGGYNIAEVFGRNYLTLLYSYVKNGYISPDVFCHEKKILLKNHILPYYYSTENRFLKNGLYKYIYNFYYSNPYFYYYTSKWFFKFIIKSIKYKLFIKKNHKKTWRRNNKHNYTNTTIKFPENEVCVGKNSYGTLNIHIYTPKKENIIIGNFVSIAENVHIHGGGEHPYKGFSTYPFKVMMLNEKAEAHSKGPVIIDDDVWIGFGATILSGVTIGRGAIIAASSVVTHDVEPYSIVAGNPARPIKYRFSEDIRKKLADKSFVFLNKISILRSHKVLYTELTDDNVDDIIKEIFR